MPTLEDEAGSSVERKERASLELSLKVLWACLGCAAILDIIGVYKGLGFNPSFQLEAQPLFFAAVIATAFIVLKKGKLGPILAGVIFWIPIIFLVAGLVLAGQVVPFGGDLVGIGEAVIATIGVLAAHNVYHKFDGGWFQSR